MNKKTLLIVLVAFVVGGGLGFLMGEVRAPESDEHMMSDGAMMHNTSMGMGNAMDDMMQDLDGKSGDAFDRAFLSGMIVHHQGAVAMAQAALQYAKHPEIKQMAQAIISAQTAEISQMQEWQKSWYGY